MNQQEFVDLAGGRFTNDKDYNRLNSTEKRKLFWEFFDDTDNEYIRSIYAGISVNELRRRQAHSIEHIIPKSFLKQYLTRQSRNHREVNGATTNPFNFAAAHRDINSKRGNFPFDVEDDRITRSLTVNIRGIYSDYGFDQESEWVVPGKSRGDIARAVLYMCIVYDIKELYGSQICVYKKWALWDPPTIWEVEFNKWIEQKHNIKNPFITSNLQEMANLLNNTELLNCIRQPE